MQINNENLDTIMASFKKEMAARGYHLSDNHLETIKGKVQNAINYNIKTIEQLYDFIKRDLLNQCEITALYFSSEKGKQYVTNQVKQLIDRGIE